MTFLAPRLRERVQIRRPVDTPESAGGLNRTYDIIATVWAGIKQIKSRSEYVRGVQVFKEETHEFTIRKSSIEVIQKGFSSAFGVGFNSITDLQLFKTDLYIFLMRGSDGVPFTAGFARGFRQNEGLKGRLFRIKNAVDKDERREFVVIETQEIEEQGTGYQA